MEKSLKNAWDNIEITQENNLDNITLDAGNNIEVRCKVNYQILIKIILKHKYIMENK